MNKHAITAQPISPIPPDDLQRKLTVARPNEDEKLPHIALMGDTYTVLLSGADTDGRYCLIDMMIPPGGGPGPHRHDFEESFTILEGEIETTFRGKKSVVRAGETINIPANAKSICIDERHDLTTHCGSFLDYVLSSTNRLNQAQESAQQDEGRGLIFVPIRIDLGSVRFSG